MSATKSATRRADPNFLLELQKYGAANIDACFNCGNCSAVCPLSTEEDNFPRRMIRYTQLGMKDELLSSKELWLCYYCGECSATCPRKADPGELMAAARRYAIGRYDRLGIARLLFTSVAFTVLLLVGLAAALALFIYSFHGTMPDDTLRLFSFIPEEVVHNIGVVAGILIVLAMVAGAVNMVVQVGRQAHLPTGAHLNWVAAARETITEVFAQRRYREGCTAGPATARLEDKRTEEARAWYLSKWFVHAAILWGFLGLFLATISDYVLALTGIKPTGTWVPIWDPVRLLGTLAGLLMLYGITAALVRRARKVDAASEHSAPSDWVFLILLWLAGVTGFALEVAIYLPQPHAWSYWMLLAHLVVVLELLIMLPFSKFAHAVYRSVALYVYALRPSQTTQEKSGEQAATA
jgi:ferredoxin/nitrate reductase gamma subunit